MIENGIGFLTDRYEISMLDSLVQSGRADRPAAFEVFTRSLQPGFRFGVFVGLNRLLDLIQDLVYTPADVAWLQKHVGISQETADWLRDFSFRGSIRALPEGSLYFPHTPVMTIYGGLGEALLLETLVLSVLNHDSAIASKAARMRLAAGPDATLIEMGSRRTHEEAAHAAARAAYISGFNTTSNLAAGRYAEIPTAGTAAHAFTLAHDSEPEAFAAQVASHGPGTTLLVDTYDIEQGIRNAVAATAGLDGAKGPGAIRIDSGDLYEESVKARALLDSLGATETKIIVSGDMDEYTIKDLKGAPIDGFGVGTKLVSTPPCGFVYKLVETTDDQGLTRLVSKRSANKVTIGGAKEPINFYDGEGLLRDQKIVPSTEENRARSARYTCMADGVLAEDVSEPVSETRETARLVRETLPITEQAVWSGDHGPYLTATYEAC